MPPGISQCPLVENHWLRLPRKQMLRDIFALMLWERKHSYASCTLSAFSWNENARLQNKRPLWKLVLHYLRVTSGEALRWNLWIPLPLNLDFVEASWTVRGPPCISINWWFPNMAAVRITDAKRQPWRFSFSGNWVKPSSQYVLHSPADDEWSFESTVDCDVYMWNHSSSQIHFLIDVYCVPIL